MQGTALHCTVRRREVSIISAIGALATYVVSFKFQSSVEKKRHGVYSRGLHDVEIKCAVMWTFGFGID